MSSEARVPAALAAHERLLRDPAIAALAGRTLAWAERYGVLAASNSRDPAVLVVLGCIFAHHCAPPSPAERALDLAARFLVLFFCIDDAPRESVVSLGLDESEWVSGALTDGLRQWRSELCAVDVGARRRLPSFTQTFNDYIAGRRLENAVASHAVSLDEHWRIRRQTTCTEPYFEQWMISTSIDATTFDLRTFAEARQTATDLVLLSNDLGSVKKDREGGESPHDLNVVHAFARAHGCSEDEALEQMIARQNDLARHLGASLTSGVERERAPAARAYADLLAGVVDGNIECLRVLDFRYRDVASILDRLKSVGLERARAT